MDGLFPEDYFPFSLEIHAGLDEDVRPVLFARYLTGRQDSQLQRLLRDIEVRARSDDEEKRKLLALLEEIRGEEHPSDQDDQAGSPSLVEVYASEEDDEGAAGNVGSRERLQVRLDALEQQSAGVLRELLIDLSQMTLCGWRNVKGSDGGTLYFDRREDVGAFLDTLSQVDQFSIHVEAGAAIGLKREMAGKSTSRSASGGE